MCSGLGKWEDGKDCYFCSGAGKIGLKICEKCKGEKRIKGLQKLTNIVFPIGEKAHKIDFLGHISRDIPGQVGHLWLVKK